MILQKIDNKIGYITLNNPKRKNVLSKDFIRSLKNVVEGFEKNPNVHVIVVKGTDGVFSAGADIFELAKETCTSVESYDFIQEWCIFECCEKPVVVGINGTCLGGGLEIAFQGDMIVMAESAKIGLPEIKLNGFPGGGGISRLVHTVGYFKAFELVALGDMIDAPTAKSLNIVNYVVEDILFEQKLSDVAKKLVDFDIAALKAIKRIAHAAQNLPLMNALILEKNAFYDHLDSKPFQEKLKLFTDKTNKK